MTELVTIDRDGPVLLIGLNRPAKRNAFDLAMIDAFSAAYERLGGDDAIRAGVVYGHGEHFCAGLDLVEVGPAVAERGPQVLAGAGRHDPFGLWRDPVPKPVVLAVNGVAFTLAIELALASDIVIAADDVRFCQLEVGRGIFLFAGAALRAHIRLGWGNAMRFLLTADEFGADQARQIGLVQDVVPAGRHVSHAVEIAQTIASQAPLGVQATLAIARTAHTVAEQAALAHQRSVLANILASEDAAEGVRSFVERRPGRFIGR